MDPMTARADDASGAPAGAAAPRIAWSKVDLHLHTTASDGVLTPAEIVALAEERGLRFIAITDHDSTEGVAPAIAAAGEAPWPPVTRHWTPKGVAPAIAAAGDTSPAGRLMVIPGVEINTDVPAGEA